MNARANAVDVKVSCASMVDEDVDADIVLVGDVFYGRSAAGTGLPVLDPAAAHGARVLVGIRVEPTCHAAGCRLSPPTGRPRLAADAGVRLVHVLDLI